MIDPRHVQQSNETAETVFVAASLLPKRSRSRLADIATVENVPNYRRPSFRMPDMTRGVRTFASVPHAEDAVSGSIGGRVLLESVIGTDDRELVPDTTISPWRRNCALRIKSKSGQAYVGTGWFIGPRTVMTAGHCVYLHDDGGWPASIEVIPGMDGVNRPYDSQVSTRFRSVDGWIQEQSSESDYGAILLDEDTGNRTGWFAFTNLSDEELLSVDANIAGYPADKDNATRQYFHARRILSLTPRRLQYDIDTFGGQSGSCIWLNLNGERVAVGIHTTGGSRGNSGTRIYKEVFDNMKLWKNHAG